VLAYAALTAVLLVIGALLLHSWAFAGLRAWDDSVSRWLAGHRNPSWDDIVMASGRMADTLPVVIAALAVEIVLALRRRWAEMLLVVLALGIEFFTFLTVNYVIARPRPDVPKLGGEPTTYSYPSGHIAATLVLWGSVAWLLTRSTRPVGHRFAPLAWVVAGLAAAVVGVSRVYRGMHHLTDVVAGAFVGVVALAVAISLVELVERRRAESREREAVS
jgi:membrane-associated phospholipid phosphatase